MILLQKVEQYPIKMANSNSRSHFPKEFVAWLIELLGDREAGELLQALAQQPPVSVRFNQSKPLPLAAHNDILTPVDWCPWGYYLSERPIFTGDPLFHAGYYYVQEASSMLLYQIKKILPEYPLTALDLCAAPGGKSSLLLDILPERSVLVSNEVVGHRANILAENLQKWGNPRSIVASAYPHVWGKLGETFDLILVDAPCSGEGMFRKDVQARSEWTPLSPMECAARQRGILDSVWSALAPGGYLIYSTCTFNRLENEDIVAHICEVLGGEPIDLEITASSIELSRLSPYPCYRMMPHRVKGEGLFMAVLRKGETEQTFFQKSDKKTKGVKEHKASIPPEVKDWLSEEARDWSWDIRQEEEVFAYPSELQTILNQFSKYKIYWLSAGVPVATLRGKSLLPHPALAYSTVFSSRAFLFSEVSYDEALAFFARELITLDGLLPRGIYLLTYRGIPLGFVKHLGNRTNNLYPMHWRVKQPDKIREAVHIHAENFTANLCLTQHLISD